MSSTSEKTIAGIILIALMIGGIFLFTRKPVGVGDYPIQLNKKISSNSGNLRIVEDVPNIDKSARHYQNLEQWHVKWSDNGDECWVDIKRDATQS